MNRRFDNSNPNGITLDNCVVEKKPRKKSKRKSARKGRQKQPAADTSRTSSKVSTTNAADTLGQSCHNFKNFHVFF